MRVLVPVVIALGVCVVEAAAPVAPPRAEPFPLADVRLLGGPLEVSQDACAAYLLGLDLDRLLARYRSETAHALEADRSNMGSGAYGKHMRTRWRDAPGGWFTYELRVRPERPAALVCTYWGRELGARTFDILIDGTKVATHTLDGNHPEAFYDVTVPLPPELTRGKEKVTVKFAPHAGNTAGGLFGLRVVEAR